MRERGITWNVELFGKEKMGNTRFTVVSTEKMFMINESKAPFTEEDFIKAMEHEIQVHVQRSVKGAEHALTL